MPTPEPIDRSRLRRQVSRVREDAALVGRVVATVVFAIAGALSGTVAGSLLTLGPRWLGVVVAVVAAVALALAIVESWRIRNIVMQRRRRHRLELAPTDATEEAQR